jgi:D-sedoheptulose 7-phosphate isomerase
MPHDTTATDARLDRYLTVLGRLPRATTATDGRGDAMPLGDGIDALLVRARAAHAAGRKLIFCGNGASASIASHMATDYSKNGGLRALALNDPVMLTTLSNDIGYAEVFSRQIGYYAQPGDLLVAISASGRSPNVLAAAAAAREALCGVVTFSGLSPDNPLRRLGDLNFFVGADEYGFVEITHLALLHAVLDLSLGWGTDDDRNPAARARRAAAGQG